MIDSGNSDIRYKNYTEIGLSYTGIGKCFVILVYRNFPFNR